MEKLLAGKKQKVNLESNTSQPANTEYEIQLTSLAVKMLADIKDQRQQKSLRDRIDQLKTEPEKQGKVLVDNLKGYLSVRAVGQRYRIIYKVELDKVLVLVVGMGLRREGDKGDIYVLMQKWLDE